MIYQYIIFSAATTHNIIMFYANFLCDKRNYLCFFSCKVSNDSYSFNISVQRIKQRICMYIVNQEYTCKKCYLYSTSKQMLCSCLLNQVWTLLNQYTHMPAWTLVQCMNYSRLFSLQLGAVQPNLLHFTIQIDVIGFSVISLVSIYLVNK